MCIFFLGAGMKKYYSGGKWVIRNELDQLSWKKIEITLFISPWGKMISITEM